MTTEMVTNLAKNLHEAMHLSAHFYGLTSPSDATWDELSVDHRGIYQDGILSVLRAIVKLGNAGLLDATFGEERPSRKGPSRKRTGEMAAREKIKRSIQMVRWRC